MFTWSNLTLFLLIHALWKASTLINIVFKVFFGMSVYSKIRLECLYIWTLVLTLVLTLLDILVGEPVTLKRIRESLFNCYREIIIFISLNIFFFCIFFFCIFELDHIGFRWVWKLTFQSFNFYIGIDGISLMFIFLTTLITPLCLIFSWYNNTNVLNHRFYFLNILLLEILILAVFLVLDIVAFYILFELILIPFYVLVTLYNFKNYKSVSSSNRKMHAFYLLLFYTLFASLVMFTAILLLYINTGTTNLLLLWYCNMPLFLEKFLWWCFFLSFSVKVPIMPFHLWLPEAHVESPTECSVLLAALLLKVGAYGFLRVLITIFPNATVSYNIFVIVFCTVSSLYTSMCAMVQIDIKRIIAYASIAHMNICILGIMTFEVESILGSVVLLFGHGLVSAGLFFSIGMLYIRYHTKNLKMFSGMVFQMPYLSFLFFFFIISNFSFPGTVNFVGEFLILFSFFKEELSFFYLVFFICIIITTTYSLVLYNKLFFGLPQKFSLNKPKKDLLKYEQFILFSLLGLIIFFGIEPSFFFNHITSDLKRLFFILFTSGL